LCSTTKIFEKLILKRINEIQEVNNEDITHKGQHGFKKNKSTLSLSLELQSIIARALENDEFALEASPELCIRYGKYSTPAEKNEYHGSTA
jgi:hypothetical protein